MQPAPDTIDQLVRIITQAVRPTRIIMYGSAARGTMRETSDIDLLVVVASEADRESAWASLAGRLGRLAHPIDLLVATEEDLRRFGGNWSLVYFWALREGKEIYAAGTAGTGRNPRPQGTVRGR